MIPRPIQTETRPYFRLRREVNGALPTTLAADESSGGANLKMTFERVIVYPNGHREIEGVTPKALPAPSPVSVENNDQLICVEKPSQNSASDDQ